MLSSGEHHVDRGRASRFADPNLQPILADEDVQSLRIQDNSSETLDPNLIFLGEAQSIEFVHNRQTALIQSARLFGEPVRLEGANDALGIIEIEDPEIFAQTHTHAETIDGFSSDDTLVDMIQLPDNRVVLTHYNEMARMPNGSEHIGTYALNPHADIELIYALTGRLPEFYSNNEDSSMEVDAPATLDEGWVEYVMGDRIISPDSQAIEGLFQFHMIRDRETVSVDGLLIQTLSSASPPNPENPVQFFSNLMLDLNNICENNSTLSPSLHFSYRTYDDFITYFNTLFSMQGLQIDEMILQSNGSHLVRFTLNNESYSFELPAQHTTNLHFNEQSPVDESVPFYHMRQAAGWIAEFNELMSSRAIQSIRVFLGSMISTRPNIHEEGFANMLQNLFGALNPIEFSVYLTPESLQNRAVIAHESGHAVFESRSLEEDDSWLDIFAFALGREGYELVDDSNYIQNALDELGHPHDNPSEFFASSFAAYRCHANEFAERIEQSDPETRRLGIMIWCYMRDQIFHGDVFSDHDPFMEYNLDEESLQITEADIRLSLEYAVISNIFRQITDPENTSIEQMESYSASSSTLICYSFLLGEDAYQMFVRQAFAIYQSLTS